MNTKLRSAAIAATMASMLAASPASAALSVAATDCRATIAKSFSSLLKTAFSTINGCHKSRDKDAALLASDCNDMAVADAAKGKFAAAVAKQVPIITAACPSSLDDDLTSLSSGSSNPEFYISCPYACTGVANPITTMADVADCLACTAEGIAEETSSEAMGLPAGLPLSTDDGKCHGAIGKGFSKFLLTAMKTSTGCQGDEDEAGNVDLAACLDFDPKTKVAGALQKAKDGLSKSCAAANVANLDGCATDTLDNVKSCNDLEWSGAEDQAFTQTYEMDSTVCPSVIRTTILGGCSTAAGSPGTCNAGSATSTRLSVGWGGLGHGLGITDSYTLAGDITCPGSTEGACGVCTIDGISTDNPQYSAFTRCVEDPAVSCSNVFGQDPVCGQFCTGGATDFGTACTQNSDCMGADVCTTGECRYFLGPPLAINAGGTPTCSLNVVDNDITGTVEPDAGESEFAVDLRAVVHLGLEQNHPCPICQNDATPQDGVRDGTCFGGRRNGLACDVQGFDLNFAPTLRCNGGTSDGALCDIDSDCPGGGLCLSTTENMLHGNSLDCTPETGANITNTGLQITLPLSTGPSTLAAEDACESPNAADDCFCGVCTLATGVSCRKDTDCSDFALGTCEAGGMGMGVARKQNSCSDKNCTAVMGLTDRGRCQASLTLDVTNYCDGLLFADGTGMVQCTSDADCTALVTGEMDPALWVCPNDNCGTCSYQKYRSCFVNPIQVEGTPDTENPILAGAFCLPPSTNGGVNSATGSPGPGTVYAESLVEKRY